MILSFLLPNLPFGKSVSLGGGERQPASANGCHISSKMLLQRVPCSWRLETRQAKSTEEALPLVLRLEIIARSRRFRSRAQ